MMPSISFLSDLDSLYEFDTVTRDKLWSPKEMRSALPWCYNARAVVPVTERAQNLAQIEKLLGSHTLHGSESLCKLLRYLANHSMDHPGLSPKEYQIATEVFGRQLDFDPHVDSMVRVQAGRLRTKLAEYYASEGADDQIMVELSKGTYALAFHPRTHGAGRNHANTSHEAPNNLQVNARTSRTWIVTVVALSVVLASAVTVATDRRSRGSSSVTQPLSVVRTLACATTIVPRIPAPRSWITIPESAKCWRCTLSTAFSEDFISKFASSAAACFPWTMPRTTISSSLARLRRI